MVWQCGAIDSGVAIFPDGKIRPCCQAAAEYSKPLESIFDPNRFQDIKLEERPAACRACWHNEDNGWNSYRSYYGSGIGKTNEIMFLDIRNSNLCNLKCRYCGPHFSNQIAKEQLREIPLVGASIEKYLPTLLTDKIIDLYFTGGEPFISQDHYEVISQLVDTGYSKNIKLRYNSNLSVIKYKKSYFLELWKQFKSVNINVSLDAAGPELNFIRSGSNWDEVKNNIEFLLNDGTVKLVLTPVVSILNIWFLPELFLFARSNNIPVLLTLLYGPDYLDISALPKSLKPLAKEKIDEIKPYITTAEFNEITYKLDNVDNEFLFNNTIRHILLLDHMRNENLFDLLPFKEYAINHTLVNNEYK